MEAIDIESFVNSYNKIEAKLIEINKIPRLHGTGSSFDSISIDEFGIYYNTTHSYCGSTDYFNLYIPFSEINEPIEYFQEKFKKEIEDDKRRQEDKKIADQLKLDKEKEEREYRDYLKLKQKFEK